MISKTFTKFFANLAQTKLEQKNVSKHKFVFDHTFESDFLKEPTCCSQCNKFFVIPFAQKCSICKFTCHPLCLNLVNSRCINSPEIAHSFTETFFLTPTTCKHCGTLVKGLPAQGFSCKPELGGCGLTVHKECKDLTRKRCFKKSAATRVTIDDFDLLEVLGHGTTSKVYLAKLRRSDKVYAIKAIKKNNRIVTLDPESTLIEANALKHGGNFPFLTKLHCCFQTETRLFLVMEYVAGRDLAYHLMNDDLPIKLTEDRARFYAAEVALALFHLHSMNFIYRDLKPENIIIDSHGHCKLIDFGLARELHEAESFTTKTICGTPAYMSPEVVDGREYSFPVDWWSFGVLIFEMLTGFLPFEGDTYDEVLKNITEKQVDLPRFIHCTEARDLLSGLLQKDPQKRLGTRSEPDIFEHAFFSRHWQWQDIAGKRLKPPPLASKADRDPPSERHISLTPDMIDERATLSRDEFAGFSYYSESFFLTDD